MDKRILICAPTGQDAILASRVLESVGIGSIVSTSAADMLAHLHRGVGALLMVEEVIAGKGFQPLADFVAAQPTWSDIPMLILTRSGADSADAARAVDHLGNVTLLERPVRTVALISAAKSALRARERQYQVRDADQRKDEFLATLAHELRNPLAPIRTSMGILQHLHPDSPEVTRVRNIVDRQVTHLTRLVDDLLDVARITSGKVVLKTGAIALRSVVNHAVEISASALEAKQHQLTISQPDGEHVLLADQARLVQSVANLLVNAAKYTPDRGRIQLTVGVQGDAVSFSVRDNGIGLEPSSLERIFELFAQTPVPGEAPAGLGIGLSLARQFAQMHGGSVSASSEGLGKGSEFILRLPVVVEDSLPTALEEKVDEDIMKDLKTRKILVVDDNVDAADTLEALLGMDGFEVITAYDGLSAVASAEKNQPDVVVMDIGMPGMDGYDAARMIRQQPGGGDRMLIALTGWGQTADKDRAADAGFNHHLVKPVDYDQLMKCLQT